MVSLHCSWRVFPVDLTHTANNEIMTAKRKFMRKVPSFAMSCLFVCVLALETFVKENVFGGLFILNK